MERRLVTILAADAVGYSRLVGVDEEAALALFEQCRLLIEGLIREYQGRIFGGAGDSLMAEFPSPVEGLRCAIEIQRQLGIAGEKLPDERRMRFRLGMNLGDVVVEDNSRLRGRGEYCLAAREFVRAWWHLHFAKSLRAGEAPTPYRL